MCASQTNKLFLSFYHSGSTISINYHCDLPTGQQQVVIHGQWPESNADTNTSTYNLVYCISAVETHFLVYQIDNKQLHHLHSAIYILPLFVVL